MRADRTINYTLYLTRRARWRLIKDLARLFRDHDPDVNWQKIERQVIWQDLTPWWRFGRRRVRLSGPVHQVMLIVERGWQIQEEIDHKREQVAQGWGDSGGPYLPSSAGTAEGMAVGAGFGGGCDAGGGGGCGDAGGC